MDMKTVTSDRFRPYNEAIMRLFSQAQATYGKFLSYYKLS
jgi:hypothetical protein